MSIGLEILIDLVSESAAYAEYNYHTTGQEKGLVRLDKASGDVELLTPSSDETDDRRLFSRVAFKLRKHWRAGEVPKSTWWAA